MTSPMTMCVNLISEKGKRLFFHEQQFEIIPLDFQVRQIRPLWIRYLWKLKPGMLLLMSNMFSVSLCFTESVSCIMFLNFCLGSCERYFLSLHEDDQRSIRGTKEKHRTRQRQLRRKKQARLRNIGSGGWIFLPISREFGGPFQVLFNLVGRVHNMWN